MNRWSRTLSVLFAAASAACATQSKSGQSSDAGWRPLFDGKTTAGWRGYKTATMPDKWFVKDGYMGKIESTNDIVSVEQFGDFELEFEWRLHEGGNAGFFYRGTEEYSKIYWSAVEYQLLDDPNAADGKSRLTSAGAAYGLYPAPEGHLKKAGEWQLTRIVAKGTHVEHWLNGFKMVEFDYGSPDYEAKVQGSKFARWPNYGKATRGHLAFQGDHNGELSLRNIRIRELK
jgi:hypothetical protein